MSEHAILPPSSAHIWVKCAGSVTLRQAYPDADSDHARDGAAAHFAGAELLAGRVVAVGQIAPNGVVLTDEMIEAAEVWADDVQATLEPLLADAWRTTAKVEQRVTIPRVHAQNWGTPDAYAWVQNFTLHVWDFKFGHGFVDVFENWQLIDYVAGILDAATWMRESNIPDERVTVVMRIVQPRNYHRDGPVREWRVKASDLRAHFNILQGAADAALGPDPQLKTGDHCEYCPARHACPALQQAAYGVVQRTGAAVPFDLPPHALGLELRTLRDAAKLLDARITGLETQALELLKSGAVVPFWQIENAQGREAWTVPANEVIMLGQMVNLELAKPPEAITPAQARRAGLSAELVDLYASRPSASKLAPLNEVKARQVFGK